MIDAESDDGVPSTNASSTVSPVVYTDDRWRSSRCQVALAAQIASSTPAASSRTITSETSWMPTQRTTSSMVAPAVAAAKSSGASNLAAVAYQNSPSPVVAGDRATSVRSAATRRAPTQVRAAGNGDQPLTGRPVAPA